MNNNTARLSVWSGTGTVMIGIQQLHVTANVSRKNTGVEPKMAKPLAVEATSALESDRDVPAGVFDRGGLGMI